MKEKRERKNKKTKSVGNGEGSFYYSEALQCYIYQYAHNGKRQTMKQRKNESIREFKARVTDIKSKKNNGTLISKSNDTFISILEGYVKQKHLDGLVSDRTHVRDLETVKQIKRCCANFVNKPIQKVTIEDIEESKSNMRDYANSTIDKMWLFINITFKIATSRRKILYNIMIDETLKKPISKKATKKVNALTLEEEQKLINTLNNEELNHKYRDIILLQLYTGMRIGEVLALTKDCINLEKNTLTVYRTLTQDLKYKVILGEHTKTFKRTTGIDNGTRTFYMNNNVKALISKILNYKLTNIKNMLFWDYNDNTFIKPYEINCYLQRLNKKYSITASALHSHRLRHTFVTRCVENGLNIKVIQTLVGHVDGSSITSDIYTSVSSDFIKKELEKID